MLRLDLSESLHKSDFHQMVVVFEEPNAAPKIKNGIAINDFRNGDFV